MQESTKQHAILTNFCISALEHGTKRFERAIAAVLIFVQITSPLPLAIWNSWSIAPANAVLYSPDTKVPRTGELALRKAIPANTSMKAIQVLFYSYLEKSKRKKKDLFFHYPSLKCVLC